MVKQAIKSFARHILFYLNKKDYKIKLEDGTSITHLRKKRDKEYFYGYYDKYPERNGYILFHEMQDDGKSVKIIVKCISTGIENVIAIVKSFNWQMGARSIWINDDIVSYNDFDGEKYVCRWHSLSAKKNIKTFDKPLQDIKINEYFLGVNYRRLRSYAKEYGYYCLPEMSEEEFDDYEHDGIWYVNTTNAKSNLLISLEEIIKFEYIDRFERGKHFVNHIMISPSGKAFIFIHRYYVNGTRYDRLMYYDFHQLQCLLNGKSFLLDK